jgi:hypothetical protein
MGSPDLLTDCRSILAWKHPIYDRNIINTAECQFQAGIAFIGNIYAERFLLQHTADEPAQSLIVFDQ